MFEVDQNFFDNMQCEFNLRRAGSQSVVYVFYETYLNELCKNGYYLLECNNVFELKKLDEKQIAKEKHSGKIKFFWDFHDAKFRKALEEIIEYRALFGKYKLDFKISEYLITNAEAKGTLRLYKQEYGSKILVKLEPIKGYEDETSEIFNFFKDAKKINSLFDLVELDGHGLKSQNKTPLLNTMNTKQASDILLSEVYSDMRSYEEGLVLNIDSEFLHNYRIHLRKARAILSQFKNIYDKHKVNLLRKELALIGRHTNNARDLDVNWLKIRLYAEETANDKLKDFLDFLKKSSDSEYKNLNKFFKSKEYKKICLNFEDIFSGTDIGTIAANNNAKASVVKKIRRLYVQLLADGNLLNMQGKDEEFHTLRKDCKKIRYLLELFQDILDRANAQNAIRLIKNLQSVLGDFQDISVQIHNITELVEAMQQHEKVDTGCLLSVGRFLGDLEKEKAVCKTMFFKKFKEFVRPQNKEIFKALFAKGRDENGSNL